MRVVDENVVLSYMLLVEHFINSFVNCKVCGTTCFL
jgi:hypothetical protein